MTALCQLRHDVKHLAACDQSLERDRKIARVTADETMMEIVEDPQIERGRFTRRNSKRSMYGLAGATIAPERVKHRCLKHLERHRAQFAFPLPILETCDANERGATPTGATR